MDVPKMVVVITNVKTIGVQLKLMRIKYMSGVIEVIAIQNVHEKNELAQVFRC